MYLKTVEKEIFSHLYLSTDHDDVSYDSIRHSALLSPVEEVSSTNHHDTNEDDPHARPPEPLQLLLQDQLGEDTNEDHDAAPEHLELRSTGEGETNVHHGGGDHITQCRGQEEEHVWSGSFIIRDWSGAESRVEQVDQHAQHLPQHHDVGLKND